MVKRLKSAFLRSLLIDCGVFHRFPDHHIDILFVGYQAQGTPGRIIQSYGPSHGYVLLDHQKLTINAGIYTISGYSAHADQRNLVQFVKGMQRKPKEIRLVHGDRKSMQLLQEKLGKRFPETVISIPQKQPG